MGKLKAVQKAADKVLDMTYEARMARAKEQGFDVEAYHGTDADFEAFDPAYFGSATDQGWYGPGVYAAPDPAAADAYTMIAWPDDYKDGANIQKLLLRNAEPIKNQHGSVTEYVVRDPKDVRSVNAAFDPAKKDSANLLAGGAAAAVGLGAATQSPESEAVPIMKGGKKIIEAFHGSPHKFDKFSMENIGTGEGAQAYGHGLYFADSEGVAREYREALAGRYNKIDPPRFKALGDKAPEYIAPDMAWEIAERGDGAIGKRLNAVDIEADKLRTQLDDLPPGSDEAPIIDSMLNSYELERAELERLSMGGFESDIDPKGALYRVHLDVDPDTLLDWDKPLSEQPHVYEAALSASEQGLDGADEVLQFFDDIDSGLDPRITGAEALDKLHYAFGEDRGRASKALSGMGIPGIRYLDGNSRNAGEGSYNYVMFDDKPISIQERGMATPEMLTATAAGTFLATREQRKGQWESLRDDLLESAGRAANFVFESAEIPWKGILGLTRLGGGMASGEGFPDALNAAVEQIQQPVDQTAHNLGGTMTDATGSPAMGTAVNLGVNLGGPI